MILIFQDDSKTQPTPRRPLNFQKPLRLKSSRTPYKPPRVVFETRTPPYTLINLYPLMKKRQAAKKQTQKSPEAKDPRPRGSGPEEFPLR